MVTRINLATSWAHPCFKYFCLSTDAKPEDAPENSTLTELDTGYEYYRSNGAWHMQPRTSSGADPASAGITGPYITFTLSKANDKTDVASATIYEFTEIPKSLFQGYTKMTAVNFSYSPSLTTVWEYGFYGCNSLAITSLPSSLHRISEFGFGRCDAIENLTIHQNITTIENGAFYDCGNMSSVVFKGTPTLAASIFGSCTKLTDIYVPWSEGAVANAPWGAPNATVHYDWSE